MPTYNRANDEAIDYLEFLSFYDFSGKSIDEAIDLLKEYQQTLTKRYCDPAKPIRAIGSEYKNVYTRLYLEVDTYPENYPESTTFSVMGVRPITPAESAILNASDEVEKNRRRKQYETLKKEFEETTKP